MLQGFRTAVRLWDNQSGVLDSNLLHLGLAWREFEFKPVTSFLELKTASNYQANES